MVFKVEIGVVVVAAAVVVAVVETEIGVAQTKGL